MIKVTPEKTSHRQDIRVHHSGRHWLVALALGATLATSCAIPVQTGSTNDDSPLTRLEPAAMGPADYARLESEVVDELNAARSNPSAYASNLAVLIPEFHDGVLRRRGWPAAVRTQEGSAAVYEAIHAMQSQPAVGLVVESSALSAAARDLAHAQRFGNVGHTGPDGSTPDSRISAHGTWGRTYNENIAYGNFPTGLDVVIDLLVDDGVPDRGHRQNIFAPSVHVVGVACGPHHDFGTVCVIDQAGTFTPH